MHWSYNFRTHYFSDDDEDDTSPGGKQNTTSDDGLLLAELDLSSRKDVARHQSNPWTIARINATTRKMTANTNAQKTRPTNVPKRVSPDNSKTALRPKHCAILEVKKAKVKSASDLENCAPAKNNVNKASSALKSKAPEQIKANRTPEGAHIAVDPGESAAITRRIASPYQTVPLGGPVRRMSPVETCRLDMQAHDMSRPPFYSVSVPHRNETFAANMTSSGSSGDPPQASRAVRDREHQVFDKTQSLACPPSILQPRELTPRRRAPAIPKKEIEARIRLLQPPLKQSNKRDAYAAFPPSPDSAWGTFPTTEAKRPRQTSATRNKNFMIPHLTANNGKTEPVERRRPVFRPPPRMATGSGVRDVLRSDTSGADDPADGEYREFKPTITVYMPLSPVSSPTPPADTARHRAQASLPSPPPSDPVLVGGTGPDERLAFRDPLKIRFAGMKRRIAERMQVSAQLWERLGLPSCGIVFKDPPHSQTSSTVLNSRFVDNRVQRNTFELPICVWQQPQSSA